LLEIVAGRIAAELEREMLLREGVDGAELKRQLAAAERTQRNQLPTIQPLLSGWEIAGWNAQNQGVGGDFYDWFALPDGLIAVAVADVMDRGIEAAVSANAVKAAMRAHGQYQRDAHGLLQQANMTLWTGSAGDQYATVFCGLVDTSTGKIKYASAGDLSVVHVRKDGWNSLVRRTARLGASPENTFRQEEVHLRTGEALVIFTDGIRDGTDEAGNTLKEEGIAAPLTHLLDFPAKELVTACRDQFEAFAADPNQDDRTVVIIKRTDS
jgi:sigma-B regulation protein RsbU (phosphoserine phosphatase)